MFEACSCKPAPRGPPSSIVQLSHLVCSFLNIPCVSTAHKKPGNVSFIAKGDEQEIVEKISESTNWAVLVLDDESKEDACKCFDPSFVLNIHEAKGLEFENVILYKFMSHEAYDKILDVARLGNEKIESTIDKIRKSYEAKGVNPSRPKDREDKSFDEHKFYVNALYVAATRAVSNVYIIEGEKQCNLLKVVAPGKGVNKVDTKDIKKEKFDPKEWKNTALMLIDNGNIEHAKGKAMKLLEKGEKEYVQEIIDALEAKEYHIQELQLSLDKDKSKQANSELKAENTTPQESSTSKSRVLTKKTRERKGKKHAGQSLNEDQEKELKKLEEKFHSALKNGDLKLAKQLIDQGVNVNAKDSSGATALYLAVIGNDMRTIHFLLGNEVDVNAKIEENYTLLHVAAQCGHKDIVELLLQHGADVNAKNKEGATPLHPAAEGGHKGIVKLLLDNKADVNAQENDGYVALHVAAKEGREEVVELLLQHGAKVNIQENSDYTALHFAAKNRRYGTVKLLLDHGAKVNAKTKEGFTPLYSAAEGGCRDVVKLLLDNGAEVNARNEKGATPLHFAVKEDHKDIVELLLQRGADVNAKTNASAKVKEGFTPLHFAAINDRSEIVDLLLADPNINVGHVKIVDLKSRESKLKFFDKLDQDFKLFKEVEKAAKGKDVGKLKKLLNGSLEQKTERSFKLGLNYSPGGDDENTTLKIAIKAGGEVLQLLYDYAEEYIGVDTKIFKQLKHAKEQQENSQPKSDFDSVSISGQFLKLKI